MRACGDLDAMLSDTPALLAGMSDSVHMLAALLAFHPAAPGMSDIPLWPTPRFLNIVEDVLFLPALEA